MTTCSALRMASVKKAGVPLSLSPNPVLVLSHSSSNLSTITTQSLKSPSSWQPMLVHMSSKSITAQKPSITWEAFSSSFLAPLLVAASAMQPACTAMQAARAAALVGIWLHPLRRSLPKPLTSRSKSESRWIYCATRSLAPSE